jgi:hypothetical protein
MPTGTAIFTDTSIHIARLLREPEMKKIIKQRLTSYDLVVSSSVVVQEFKRRVLPEAIYLMINQLNHRGSYQKVRRHVTILPDEWKRKRQICFGMLDKIFETVGKTDDSELTERAKRYLHTLIKHGVKYFQSKVDHVIPGTNCYLSKLPVKVKKPYKKYEPIETKCSKVSPLCPIVDFLKEKIELCKQLLGHLSNLPNKTKELESTLEFLRGFVTNPDAVHEKDPCYCVGDLLIALESYNIPDFYTMNYKESKVFCDILDQNLIVRPNNPDKPDEIYSKTSKPWNLQ